MANYLAPPVKNTLVDKGFLTLEGLRRVPGALGGALYNTFVSPVVNTGQFVQQAMTGQIPMYAADESGRVTINPRVVEGSLDTAATMLGGSAATGAKQALTQGIDPATLRMMAGPSAKTANLTALKTAQEMAAKGAAPSEIYDATKWFQGADKKWRFEIPDTQMQFTQSQNPTLVGNVITHPDLFSAYPDLANQQLTSVGYKTYSTPQGINVSYGQDNAAARSAAAHELQHQIQDIEGFEKGGNRLSMRYDYKELLDAQKQDYARLDDLLEQARNAKGRKANKLYDEWENLRAQTNARSKMLDRMNSLGAQYDTGYGEPPGGTLAYYNQLAGETEARNVQKRLEKGYSKYPWETQDVPYSEQFIRGTLFKGPR